MTLFLVDEGALLEENDEEFASYNSVYDHKYGYYDIEQSFFKTLDEAKNEARRYINSVEYGYAVVTEQSGYDDDLTDEGLNEVPVSEADYDVSNVVFSIRKDPNGTMTEGFVEKDADDRMRILTADMLPAGWEWHCFNDGSGSLHGPAGEDYFSYDLQTREYVEPVSEEWKFWKDYPDPMLFHEFKQFAEEYMLQHISGNNGTEPER